MHGHWVCVLWVCPLCNVNHPVQGWVCPKVSEAKNQTEREVKVKELPKWKENEKKMIERRV